MPTFAELPEIRCAAGGKGTVIWTDGETIVDLVPLRVGRIERVIMPGELPIVRVDFIARLVEVGE